MTTRWWRWGGALLALGVVAALAGCGQLFAQGQQPPTLTELSNRVDSLDAQVGEMQAALANMGGSSTSTTAAGGGGSNGVVQPGKAVAVVQAAVLNVRSEPSLSGVVVGTLLQNAEVNVLGETGNWDEITFTNSQTGVHLTGWVDADYLGPISTDIVPGATVVPGASATAGSAKSGVTKGQTTAKASASGSGSGSGTLSGSTSY